MSQRSPASDELGYTLIEVLVGIFILLIGVLGVVSLVDGANAVTSKTRAREAGTNVARSIVEVSRAVRYRDLTTDALVETLSTRPGLADSNALDDAYTIESRGVEYEVTIRVCSLDDPKDRLGEQTEGIVFCPDTDVPAPTDTILDNNPDDYKRVRVTLRWETRAIEETVTQTSAIINPVGGLGPSVIGLTMTEPAQGATETLVVEGSDDGDAADAPDQAVFAAQTSAAAATVKWSVDGDPQGEASTADPASRAWEFTWDLERDDGTSTLPDCNYLVQADAFDAQGRGGAPRAVTVVLNRLRPSAPPEVAGGRNGNGNYVDLEWEGLPDCDVLGYRVYRSTSPGSLGTQITCVGQGEPTTPETECIDDAPVGDLYYRVVGVDVDPEGNVREGDLSAQLPVVGSNLPPGVPENVSSCIGGQPDCLRPDGEPADSGLIVLRWDASSDSDGTVDFYRIYRDSDGDSDYDYDDRHGVFVPNAETVVLAWLEHDPDPDGASHTYRVTAVDDDFGESGLSAEVTAP